VLKIKLKGGVGTWRVSKGADNHGVCQKLWAAMEPPLGNPEAEGLQGIRKKKKGRPRYGWGRKQPKVSIPLGWKGEGRTN